MTAKTSVDVRRRRARLVGWVAATAFVVVAGLLVWQIWGTTWVASSQARTQVAGFYDANPAQEETSPALHTDLDLYPVPDPVVTAGTWGVLHVPSWRQQAGVYGDVLDGKVPIAEGTESSVLDRGWAGHFAQSGQVGQVGNFDLAGHRRSYGQNFLHVPDLKLGDVIAVEDSRTWYVYQVTTAPFMVDKDDVSELAAVPGDDTFTQPPAERLLTLYTCTTAGFSPWGNDHRAIVHATFLGWVERSAGTPAEVQ